MALTLEQFGKALAASGLMTPEDVRAFWNAVPAAERPKDAEGFAQRLVAQKLLTEFQAKQLLAGRGASLVMGDYAVLAEIGAGGMGQVYKARHRRMERIVALKVMSSAAMKDEAAVKRFQREVRAAARLEHPNIVTAYDSGEAGSVKYLVMQFVDGGDLSDLVKKNGPLPIEKAVDYVIQAARGLAFAHAEGVIHRDIKPANLLLDKKGIVKILDMGLARIESSDDGLTATEQVMGTVDYMSPEQAANTKGADGRADIYSLGCTLWFLLTGKKAYDGDTMIARLMAHREAPLPSLVKTRDDAPWALEQALHKMLAKRPQDRFQSMDEVVAALEPFSGGGSSKAGMGSSIGMGKQADAELAAFFQNVGPKAAAPGTKTGVSKTEMEPKSATAAGVEATAAFQKPEADTDPKSQLLGRGQSAVGGRQGTFVSRDAKQSAPAGKKQPPVKLIAGGVLGVALLVVAGIIIKVRDRDGNVVAELNVPGGATVEITPTAPAATAPAPPAAPEIAPSKLLESREFAWSTPENLGPPVNTERSQINPTLTADELCLVCVSQPEGNLSELVECVRPSIDAPFGPPKRLTGATKEKEPCLSADGLTLIYASEVGSFGKHDLWIRRRATRDVAWGAPVHLLQEINGPDDERSPNLSLDGLTLVFSSDRPGGMGKYDIWSARRKTPTGSFEKAVNFDPRLNTRDDEISPKLLSDGQTLLFNRNFDAYHLSFKAASGISSSLPVEGLRANDGWLSPDARRWYFTGMSAKSNRDIWLMRRVPGTAAATPPATSAASAEFLTAVPAASGSWTYGPAKPLFDGKSLAGWSGDTALVSIENGVLVNDGKRGVVIAPGEYRNFEVELDFRLAAVGNSGLGIFYPGDGDPAAVGLEVQMLDDAGYPNVHAKQRCGSLYQVSAATPGQYRAWPEWNHMVVRALGDQLEVELNAVSILKVSKAELQGSNPGHAGLKRDSGKIALFPHTGRSEYRNFVVREATLGAPIAPSPPPGDYALDFSASKGVWLQTLTYDANQPCTVELRATPRVIPSGITINSPLYSLGHFSLKQYTKASPPSSQWECVLTHENKELTTLKLGPAVAGRTNHIAVVSTGKEVIGYLDGKLVARQAIRSPLRELPGATIGRYSNDPQWGPFAGWIDEVRFSKIARYSNDYAPQSRLEADADTLALYHFDEGSGDVIKDSSNNGHDGRIADAEWVRADGSPLGAAPAEFVYLDDLPEKAWHGYQELGKHGQGVGGAVLSRNGERIVHSLMTPPTKPGDLSFVEYDLGGRFEKFEAVTYLTREPTGGPQTFRVLTDGKKLWESPPQTLPNVEAEVSLSMKGVKLLRLEVAGLTSNSHPLWLEPRLTPNAAAAAVPAATTDHALRFDGKSAHVVLPLTHDADSPLTVEATLLPGEAKSAVVSNSEGRGIGIDLDKGAANSLISRELNGVEGYVRATAPQPLDTSLPHRLAAVYDGTNLRLFVDGKLQATTELKGKYLPSPLPFIIGASPEGAGIDYPFTGTIDEVRISKTARYTQDYAPTPRLEADADTLALYHFDEGSGDVLRDSSGNGRNGKIVGAKWVQAGGAALAGVPRNALQLTGAGYVDLKSDWIYDGGDLTFEAWLISDTPRYFQTLLAVDHDAGGRRHAVRLGRQADGIIEVARPSEQLILRFDDTLPTGRPTHLAAVWKGPEIRVYVDGKQLTSWPHQFRFAPRPGKPYAWMGGMPADAALTKAQQACEAILLETRITSRARYDGDFTPPSQLTADADTVSHFQCNEGTGDLLRDSSGRGRHGKIVGAKWVRSVGPTSAVVPAVVSSAGGGLDLSAKLNPGAARVGLPQFLDREKPITVEMVVTPRSLPGATAKNRKLWQFEFFDLKQYGDQWEWLANVYGDDGKRLPALTARGVVQPDKRAHLAGVWTGKELRFFVDGKLIGSTTLTKLPAPLTYNSHVIGGKNQDSVDYSPFDGILHEARISQTARYDRDYVPADRLEADADTAALYRCDEGCGDVLRDSSGHGHDGRIIGATWVVATPAAAKVAAAATLFTGTDLAGWKGDPKVWTWEKGELVGRLSGTGYTFLAGTNPYQDFELTYEVRLQGDQANSGVQFRSAMLPPSPFDMTGPQCEIGGTGKTGYGGLWWEKGTANGVKAAVPPEKYGPLVKPDDYNRMTVRCVGKHVTITLNGTTTVDGDFEIAPQGLLGFQLVARGAPVEVRVRNIEFRDLSQRAAASGPFDLLANLKIPADVRLGNWRVVEGVLHTPPIENGINTAVLYLSPERPLPAEYDVELQVERQEPGGSGMVVGIVSGERQATVMMDSYGSTARWGIEDIDGLGLAKANPTTVSGRRLTLDQKKMVRIEVRRGGVRVFVEAEKVVDWQGRPEQLSTNFWNVEKKQSLFLGSQARFQIHKLLLTPR